MAAILGLARQFVVAQVSKPACRGLPETDSNTGFLLFGDNIPLKTTKNQIFQPQMDALSVSKSADGQKVSGPCPQAHPQKTNRRREKTGPGKTCLGYLSDGDVRQYGMRK